MKPHTATSATALAILLIQFAVFDAKATAADPMDVQKLVSLKAEKRDLMKERYEEISKAVDAGKAAISDKINAEYDYLLAELETKTDARQGLTTSQLIVDNRRWLVETKESGFRAGDVTKLDVIESKISFTEEEIRFWRSMKAMASQQR